MASAVPAAPTTTPSTAPQTRLPVCRHRPQQPRTESRARGTPSQPVRAVPGYLRSFRFTFACGLFRWLGRLLWCLIAGVVDIGIAEIGAPCHIVAVQASQELEEVRVYCR